MASVDLLFSSPPLTTPGSVDLVFGAADTSPDDRAATLAITLPPLAASIALRSVRQATVAGQLPGLVLVVSAIYDNAVSRPTVANCAQPWQPAAHARADTLGRWRPTQRTLAAGALPWRPARLQGVVATIGVGKLAQHCAATGAVWQVGDTRTASTASRWDALSPQHRPTHRAPWVAARPLDTVRASGWESLDRNRRPLAGTGWQPAQPRPKALRSPFGPASPRRTLRAIPWQDASVPRPGLWLPDPVTPPVDEPCYTPDPHLVFDDPANSAFGPVHLLFRCPPAPLPPGVVVIPVLEYYLVTNNVTLTRVADGHPIPYDRLSLTTDVDSMHAAFDAALPLWAQDDVMPAPDPVLLAVSINGSTWHMWAETISRERRFGGGTVRVSGRGLAAELDGPWAPEGNYHNTAGILTAQQAATGALPFGWSLDWGLSDWLVPAGSWNHSGTPASALSRIAEAGAGFILPARAARTVRIRPRYPDAPWRWAALTPDVVMPADIVERESLEYRDKPVYDVVDVVGSAIYRTRRTGTAGDLPAPQITDDLVTDAVAGRQRGLAILSDTGRQIHSTYAAPVLADYGGVLEPGQILDLVEGDTTTRNLVRSVRVEVAGLGSVWQHIGVEAHVV